MSINLHVEATTSVILSTGKTKTINEKFNLKQTRTNDTYKILSSNDKYLEYKNLYHDENNKLFNWLKKMKNEGYTIDWYAM